ncbi:MAG: Holliday junction resolvase RuvX [Candidatus Shapirobacteria bacterium]|nr:Holliday junction resolvase RuvX [Candidatus Shapirobacteria bacterium]
MNLLAIDYGTKRIGLAISIKNIITPIDPIKNDSQKFSQIQKIIDQYQIEKIYIGISEGDFAIITKDFIKELKKMVICSIETVEEAVSTIEANQIFITNKNKKKNYKNLIDSISAAVILRRANTY